MYNVSNSRYVSAVASVLTSVHKTEESLKRLRKDRSSILPQGASDDEKIRLQLAIDVRTFLELVKSMDTDETEEIRALRELVADQAKQSSPTE